MEVNNIGELVENHVGLLMDRLKPLVDEYTLCQMKIKQLEKAPHQAKLKKQLLFLGAKKKEVEKEVFRILRDADPPIPFE